MSPDAQHQLGRPGTRLKRNIRFDEPFQRQSPMMWVRTKNLIDGPFLSYTRPLNDSCYRRRL